MRGGLAGGDQLLPGVCLHEPNAEIAGRLVQVSLDLLSCSFWVRWRKFEAPAFGVWSGRRRCCDEHLPRPPGEVAAERRVGDRVAHRGGLFSDAFPPPARKLVATSPTRGEGFSLGRSLVSVRSVVFFRSIHILELIRVLESIRGLAFLGG